jgi:uncharacterized phage protein (TIGR01671 family)
MREYLFRGKRKDNNEWVYGCLVNNLFIFDKDKSPVCYIVPDPNLNESVPYYDCWEDIANWIDDYEVIHETVGQFIGMRDKNGGMIYNGDILKGKFGTGIGGKTTRYKQFNFKISYHDHSCQFHLDMPNGYGNYRFCPHLTDCEIIGTVTDNPELLK